MAKPSETFKRFDPFVTLPILYLLGLSTVVLNSITRTAVRVEFDLNTQLVAIFIGALLFLFGTQSTAIAWRRIGLWVYIASLVSLVLVPIWGNEVNGSTRWLEFGGFQFQPSELAKLGLIALQARLLSLKSRSLDAPWSLGLSIAYLAVPSILILLQPDLGTIIVLVLVWFGMLAFSTVNKRTLVLIAAAMFLSVPLSYPFLADYQQERIDTFFNPTSDIQAEGYNVLQATIATGSGGWLGKGLDSGSQSQLSFLPAQHTDFIFSVIAEKLGFVGSVTVILALTILVTRLIYLAHTSTISFVRYFIAGVAILLTLQIGVNIAMNLGIFPVTGLPLPFVSYGGTHIVINLLMVGAALGMRSRE